MTILKTMQKPEKVLVGLTIVRVVAEAPKRNPASKCFMSQTETKRATLQLQACSVSVSVLINVKIKW